MNHFIIPHDHQQQQQKNKQMKKRLTDDQVSLLESSFNINKKLDPQLKLQLSRELAIPPRQIAIWYQNKRARWKNQSLELDYSALQLRLQNTLSDKKNLQKEVERLRHQLHQTQLHLSQIQSQTQTQTQTYPLISSLSNCYDEAGSSSDFNGDHMNNNSRSWDMNDEVLQVEEMYAACFMGDVNGSSNDYV